MELKLSRKWNDFVTRMGGQLDPRETAFFFAGASAALSVVCGAEDEAERAKVLRQLAEEIELVAAKAGII